MMLDEINRKHEQMKAEREEQARRDAQAKPKTIGVLTPPDVYRRLKAVKERHNLKSLKEAMLYVARIGLDEVESGRKGRESGGKSR